MKICKTCLIFTAQQSLVPINLEHGTFLVAKLKYSYWLKDTLKDYKKISNL